MPKVSTRVDLCRGHDACPPRPFETSSPNVFAEGIRVAREGDTFKAHSCSSHTPHSATVVAACPTVFANGRRIAVIGSLVDCPSVKVGTGRATVFAGGR